MDVVEEEEISEELEVDFKVERLEENNQIETEFTVTNQLEDTEQLGVQEQLEVDGNEELVTYLEDEIEYPIEATPPAENQTPPTPPKKSKRKSELIVKKEDPGPTLIKSEKLECEECEDEFTSEKKFRGHIKIVEKKTTDIKFECSTCKTQFNTRKQYKLHAKIHKNFELLEKKKISNAKFFESPENENVCQFCNKTFPSLELYGIHIKGHEGNNTNLVLPKGDLKITDKSLVNKPK